MAPRLGDIVLYQTSVEDPDRRGQELWPAIVLQIWTDDCLNLAVFNEFGGNDLKTAVLLGMEPNTWRPQEQQEL